MTPAARRYYFKRCKADIS